jgi:hypothetical protein
MARSVVADVRQQRREEGMLTVDQIESIRRAYHLEGKSIRAVARELGHGRRVIREAISGADPPASLPAEAAQSPPGARPGDDHHRRLAG